MPYEFSIDRAARLAFVRGYGPVDLEEALCAPVTLASQPEFEADFGVVVDMRDIEYEPRAGDVVAVGRNLVRLRPLFRRCIAVVVPRRLNLPAELGAAIASAGGFSVQVFEDPEAARAWVEAAVAAERGAA